MPDNVAKKKGENIGSIDCPEQDTEKELSPSVQIQACKEAKSSVSSHPHMHIFPSL